MARVPRSSDSPAPKKRTPKAKPEAEVSTKVAEAAAKPATETVAAPNLEEKVRVRAYELYLQRNGHCGSPEQDWLQAVAEVCGQVGA